MLGNNENVDFKQILKIAKKFDRMQATQYVRIIVYSFESKARRYNNKQGGGTKQNESILHHSSSSESSLLGRVV